MIKPINIPAFWREEGNKFLHLSEEQLTAHGGGGDSQFSLWDQWLASKHIF